MNPPLALDSALYPSFHVPVGWLVASLLSDALNSRIMQSAGTVASNVRVLSVRCADLRLPALTDVSVPSPFALVSYRLRSGAA